MAGRRVRGAEALGTPHRGVDERLRRHFQIDLGYFSLQATNALFPILAIVFKGDEGEARSYIYSPAATMRGASIIAGFATSQKRPLARAGDSTLTTRTWSACTPSRLASG